MVKFGHSFKDKYFKQLEKDIVLVNHGSYGTTPTPVIEEHIAVMKKHEDYPDRFQYFEGGDLYIEQVQALAKYMGLEEVWKSIVLVANATTGVNTVLRSFPWDFQKDKVLFHSTTYGACANTVEFLHDYYGLQYEVVELQYPMEDVDVVAAFERKLSQGGFTMCMFDMISSQPGLVLPYEQLVTLCHKYKVLSLLDGAHAAGLVDFEFIKSLKPTFVVSNLHKWMYVPKSCAMLYVDPQYHDVIQSIPVSWNYHLKPSSKDMLLLEKFARTGTVSYSSYLCVKKAIEFRSIICGGESKIRQYQLYLQRESVPKIIELWSKKKIGQVNGISSMTQPRLLENKTKTLTSPGMFSILYPLDKIKYRKIFEKLSTDPTYYGNLYGKFAKIVILQKKTYSPFNFHNNEIYVRFSAQVFNEVQDYVIAAKLFDKVFTEILDQELVTMNNSCSCTVKL